MRRDTDNRVLEILDLLENEDTRALARAVGDVHPADLAQMLDELSAEQKVLLFKTLSAEAAGEMLNEADEGSQQQIITDSDDDNVVSVLEALPPDEAADVLDSVAAADANRLLKQVPVETARPIEQLMAYPEGSAGSVMTTDFIALQEDMSVAQAMKHLQMRGAKERISYPYVVDGNGTLVGIVPFDKLVFSSGDVGVPTIMQSEVFSVTPETDQEEVGKLVRRYDLYAVPVVDNSRRLVGVVSVDDAIEVIEEEASEDMYRIAGTGERDPLHASLTRKLCLRLPWLVVTLLGGLLICAVVRSFEGSISKAVALVSFLPLIPLMGGNVAIQASTIVVRGIALGRIDRGNMVRLVLREVIVALVLGIICGAVVGLIAVLGFTDPVLVFVVAPTVFLAVVVAAIMGTIIPLFFNAIGVDPALAAGPFVTILNDLVSVTGYLALATLFLNITT